MASRSKPSPEVADLIRTVEAVEGWSVKVNSRVAQFLHPDGQQVLRLDLGADATDLKRTKAALDKFGVLGGDTITQTTREDVVIRRDEVEDPYSYMSIYEKGKKVWKAMRDYAVATNKPMALFGSDEFFVIEDKKLAFFVAKVLPKIATTYEGPGGSREVYDYLRATGNALRERDDDDNSLWVCRTQWNEGETTVLIRSPRKAISDYERNRLRKEARLREEEVSQRLRAPQDDLTITKKEPATDCPTEEPAMPDTIDLTDEAKALLDEAQKRKEMLTCPECKAEGEEYVAGNPQGLAMHRKSRHGVEPKGTSHLTVVSKIKPTDPKAEVGIAFQMLAEAMDLFMTKADPNEALIGEVARLGTQVAEMQQQINFLKADHDSAVSRAERAEEIIECIRLAFESQPIVQAAASTIDLLPMPPKDK